MNTLGLSFDFHDASAALVTDGMVVAASEEERFTRKKHDPDFPLNAIRFCLETGKLTADDLDAVVFYEKPWLKFDRILKHSVVNKEDPKSFEETIRYWLQKRKYCPVQRIVEALNIDSKRIHFVEHHQAHAASAFYCSPFKRATIVTLDGVGEYETCTVSIGEGSQIVKMYATELPHSLGLLYSAFTAFLGFEVNEGEYKVMGMAGFGQPKFLDRFRALVNLLPDGRFEVNQKYFNFSASGEVPFDSALSDFIGYGRREPESRFELGDPHINPEGGSIEWESRYYADIAASIQALTEEVISHVVLKAVEATEIPDVCIAGGVGLNSSANGKLQKLIPGKLYIHPASGDGGGSIGAALFHHHMNNHMRRHGPLDSAFLGRGTNDAEIESTLKKHFISSFCKYESRERLFTEIAKRLASGEIGEFSKVERNGGRERLEGGASLPIPLEAT